MAEPADLSILILQKVSELLAKITPDQAKALADGNLELAVVSAVTSIKPKLPAAEEPRRHEQPVPQPAAIPAPQAVPARKSAPVPKPMSRSGSDRPSLQDATKRLPEFTDRDEAEAYLKEAGFTTAELKEVAKELSITVRGTKSQLIKGLALNAGAYKTSHQAILGGPYRQ